MLNGLEKIRMWKLRGRLLDDGALRGNAGECNELHGRAERCSTWKQRRWRYGLTQRSCAGERWGAGEQDRVLRESSSATNGMRRKRHGEYGVAIREWYLGMFGCVSEVLFAALEPPSVRGGEIRRERAA